MSSGSEPASIDSGAETGYALGAFFGVVLFNLALVGVALILRRVTRPKDNAQGNSVELKNGKYNRKPSVEVKDHGGNVAAASAVVTRSSHNNDAFVDVDLDDNDHNTQDIYEKPDRSGASGDDNQYSALNEVKVDVNNGSEDQSYIKYENVSDATESEKQKAKNSEAEMCY